MKKDYWYLLVAFVFFWLSPRFVIFNAEIEQSQSFLVAKYFIAGFAVSFALCCVAIIIAGIIAMCMLGFLAGHIATILLPKWYFIWHLLAGGLVMWALMFTADSWHLPVYYSFGAFPIIITINLLLTRFLIKRLRREHTSRFFYDLVSYSSGGC